MTEHNTEIAKKSHIDYIFLEAIGSYLVHACSVQHI